MVTGSATALFELPETFDRELFGYLLGGLLASEDTREDVLQPDQNPSPAPDREAESGIEAVCERIGYRIGRFLGDIIRPPRPLQSYYRDTSRDSFHDPIEAAIRSTLTLDGNLTKSHLPGPIPGLVSSGLVSPGLVSISLVSSSGPDPYSSRLDQVLQQVKRLVVDLLRDIGSAILVISKGRVAKVALAGIIGSVAAEVVLGGIGVSGLVAQGGIPRLADIAEQVIDLSGSLGEFALGFLLSPSVAEITISVLVVLALILYRRWEKHQNARCTSSSAGAGRPSSN
jgi:hypothetical protein